MNAAEQLLESAAERPEPEESCQSLVDNPAHTWSDLIAMVAPFTAELVGSCVYAIVWDLSFHLDEAKRCLMLGLALFVMTASLAPISGAHLNPAVSLAVGLTGKGEWCRLGKYMVVQVVGSMCGMSMSWIAFGRDRLAHLGYRNGHTHGEVFTIEFVYTGMIAFVCLNTMFSRALNPINTGNQFFAIAVGFAMVTGVTAGGNISGAVFNPALAFAIMYENLPHCEILAFLWYAAPQFFGAIVAAIAFRGIRPLESKSYPDWREWKWTEYLQGFSPSKMFSEVIGTWLCIFSAGLAASSGRDISRPWAVAGSIISMHYCLADISGGYFNPAVTFAVMIARPKRCSVGMGLSYMIMQLLSASFAAGLCQTVNPAPSIPWSAVDSKRFHAVWVVFPTEFIFMSVAAFSVLACSTMKGIKAPVRDNYFHGLAYGLAMGAGCFATTRFPGGGVINPSLALSIELARAGSVGFSQTMAHVGLMITFEFGGGLVAALVFKAIHWSKDEVEETEEELEQVLGALGACAGEAERLLTPEDRKRLHQNQQSYRMAVSTAAQCFERIDGGA